MCTSAALQLWDEQALLNGRIEIAHQRPRTTVLAERHCPKSLADKLLKALLREGHRLDIRCVEFVSRVARPTHYDLYAHLVTPYLALCSLSRGSAVNGAFCGHTTLRSSEERRFPKPVSATSLSRCQH